MYYLVSLKIFWYSGTDYGNSSYNIFETLVSDIFHMICVSEFHFYIIEYLQFTISGKIFSQITFTLGEFLLIEQGGC